jgi:hypothetical protein
MQINISRMASVDDEETPVLVFAYAMILALMMPRITFQSLPALGTSTMDGQGHLMSRQINETSVL